MTSKLCYLFCVLCISLSMLLGCEDIDPGPDDDNSGGSVISVCKDGAAEFDTIQEAVNSSSTASVIEVCPGTYTENLSINQKDVTIRSKEGRASTIIEAARNGSTISITGGDAPGVVIEGFTIRGGTVGNGMGGGISCNDSTLELVDNAIMDNSARNGGGIGAQNCTLQLTGNHIFKNQAVKRGGGAWISTSQGAVENNEIYENSAEEGGGIAVESIGFSAFGGMRPREEGQGATPGADGLTVRGNTIRNNSATPLRRTAYNIKESGGGGIWMGGDSPIIENIIKDNTSSINGAGLYVVNGYGPVVGNEIRGNTAAEDGGGVLINACGGHFDGNLITENHSKDDAGGLRVYFGFDMLIENNIISRNTAVDASGGAKLSHSQNRFFNNTLEENEADTAGALELDNDASIVKDCIFRGNRARLGAALHAKAANNPVVIQDSLFDGNSATAYGGALHFENNAHAVTLTGIEAINNSAPKGGAIATNNSTLDISDAIFKDNTASDAGGALFLSGFEADLADEAMSIDIDVSTNEDEPKLVKLRRLRFTGNSALNGGAVFATEHTLLDAANLIVTENHATDAGGGMSLKTPRGTLSSSVVTGNAANSAAGLLLAESDELTVRNCIVTDNQGGEGLLTQGTPAAIWYCDVYNNQGGDYAGMPSATGTNGNISKDPGFINDQGPDYQLKPGSPCIDTGDPDEALRDLDGTRSDMGAYAGPDGHWEVPGDTDDGADDPDDGADDPDDGADDPDDGADDPDDGADDPDDGADDPDDGADDPDDGADDPDDGADDPGDGADDPDDGADDPGDGADDPSDGLVIVDPDSDADPSQAFLSVAEKLQWPAGGHELIIRAETSDGFPWEGHANQLSISVDSSDTEDQPDIELGYSVAAQPMEPGLTLIAVQPEIQGDSDDYIAAIRSFIDSRPEEERIALYGWGDSFIQIIDFTTSRDRLGRQLQRLNRLEGDAPVSPRDVLVEALDIIKDVGKGNRQGMRSIVLISGNEPAEDIPNTLQGVTVQWVLPQTAIHSLGEGRSIGFNGPSDLSDSLLLISERLDDIAANSFFKIGVCSDPYEKIKARVSDGSGGYAASLKLKKSFDGEQNGICDPETIVAGQRDGVHTVSFFLSEEESAVYQERLDAVDALYEKYNLSPDNAAAKARYLFGTSRNGFEGAKDRFNLTLTLDPSREPVSATAKFRGQNALFRDRKSYTVNIEGGDQRFFGDGAGSDEFYLIAMAQDQGLFRGYMGDTLYSEHDLFPLRFRYVELKMNNETQGVYLMLEKRDEELQKDNARLRGVVRRRLTGPEVEFAMEDEAATLDAYTEMVGGNILRRAKLPEHWRERMDLDQYLHWMGINSMLEIADSQDEILFISTESIDENGQPTDYFRVMGWDPEDMQGACESGDLYSNDYDLTYCQEAAIEGRMIRTPDVFSDYVDIMKTLISEITPEKYQALSDKIKAELFPLLERDGVAQAMQIPGMIDAESAKAMISEDLAQSLQQFESRLDVLKAGIQEYEEDNR